MGFIKRYVNCQLKSHTPRVESDDDDTGMRKWRVIIFGSRLSKWQTRSFTPSMWLAITNFHQSQDMTWQVVELQYELRCGAICLSFEWRAVTRQQIECNLLCHIATYKSEKWREQRERVGLEWRSIYGIDH